MFKIKNDMKATELRIGNLVTVDNPKYHPQLKGVLLRVTGVQERSISGTIETSVNLEHSVKSMVEYQTYSQFIEYIKPIPLTEQWLLDLGFNQSIEGQWYIHFDNMCLTLYEDSEQYIVEINDMEIDESSIFLKSIQYVHQLQNLYFALAQEELILKQIDYAKIQT